MRKCARAIICIEDEYVFIKRVRNVDGKIFEYYVTVGGHLDGNESHEEALYREVFEEIGVNVKSYEFLKEIECEDMNKIEKFYLVELENNDFTHGNGPEFSNVNFEKYGSYEIVKIPKNKISNYNILPDYIKNSILNNI